VADPVLGRATIALPGDPLVQACALTYTVRHLDGRAAADDGSARPSSSLDHALWFHAASIMNDWVLLDYQPRASGAPAGHVHGLGVHPGRHAGSQHRPGTLFR